MKHAATSVLLLVCGTVGCSDGNETSPPNQPAFDSGVRADASTIDRTLSFESTVIDGLNSENVIGDNAVLALDAQDRPTIAYGALVQTAPTVVERVIRYTFESTDGEWIVEDVERPDGDLVGLGLAHVDGVPHVVYFGGDDDGNINTPYPTDLALSTRTGGQWGSPQILADTSADALGVCPGVQDYCNSGNVVGSHAAIAARGSAYAVVYRDTHFGFDDVARADVEVVASGLSFDRSVVDPGRSGGAFSGIALTPDNRPVLAYNLETEVPTENRVGVWAAVWKNDDWTLTKLDDAQTAARTAVAASDDGTLYVAYFDANNDDLVLATSTDDGETWDREVVEATGKVGLHPAIALDSNDRPVLAYTYCGRTTDRDCPRSLIGRSEVRLARQTDDGWLIDTVDDGQGQGGVGLFNSVAVAADGTIYVAFQDARNSDLLIAKAQPR